MNILFVDDHTIFRDGVAGLIESDDRCDTLFTAPDIQTAKTIMEKENVELVVTDLNFPGDSGLTLLDYLRVEKPEIPVIVLSMIDDLETIQGTLRRGARGYITKSSGFISLARAIEAVSDGGYHFDQYILAKMTAFMTERSTVVPSLSGSEKKLKLLSNRQEEIFLLLAKGYKLEEIAEEFYISTKTVENHRSQIYKKLGVKDRLELHKLAEEMELL